MRLDFDFSLVRVMPVNTATRQHGTTSVGWMASKAPESPRLPYGVSFFSILIVFSGVGNASVGTGVVRITTVLQSGPPQPMSQKHRLALVQNCEKGNAPKKKRERKGEICMRKNRHINYVCMCVCMYIYRVCMCTHTQTECCSS